MVTVWEKLIFDISLTQVSKTVFLRFLKFLIYSSLFFLEKTNLHVYSPTQAIFPLFSRFFTYINEKNVPPTRLLCPTRLLIT